MSNNSRFRVGVVGMGPVGSTIAAHLIEAGIDVIPCDINRRRIDAVKAHGLVLRNSINKTVPVKNAAYAISELTDYDLDLLVFSVKCPYLKAALEETRAIDVGRFFLMSAQNGIGTEEDIATVFGDERTLRMVINFAGNMIGQVEAVDVTFFNPPNYVAALSDEGKEMEARFVDWLNSAGLTTEVSDDVQIHVWTKAILNIALCAPCAVTGKTMGEVMSFPPTLAMVTEIIRESVSVAKAEGINLAQDFLDSAIAYLNKGGKHKPTMLVDVENRLLTEIDYLNGKIEAYGRKHGIPTPLNSAFTAVVKLLESGYRE